jgi:hypothetical protein
MSDRVPSLTSLPAPLRAVLDKAAKAVVADGIRYDYSIVGSELGKNLHKYLHDEAWPAWWEVWGQVARASTLEEVTHATRALLVFCQGEFPALMAAVPSDKLLAPMDGFIVGLVHAVECQLMLQTAARQDEDNDASPSQRLGHACEVAVKYCEDTVRQIAHYVHAIPAAERDGEMHASLLQLRERTVVRGAAYITGTIERFPELSQDLNATKATIHQVLLTLLDRHLGFIYAATRQTLEQHEVTRN